MSARILVTGGRISMERLTQMGDPGWGYCWTKLAFSDATSTILIVRIAKF